MFLTNRLIVVDLLLLLSVVLFFIIQTGNWKDMVLGFATVLLIFSIGSHIGHYKKTKKLY